MEKKKLLLGFIISFIIGTNLFASPSSNAVNDCVANISTHVKSDLLDVSNCSLSAADVPAIMTYLESHQNIKYLIAEHNNLDDKAAVAFAKNKTLAVLVLEKNQIEDDGAIALAGNKTLKLLVLDNNLIGDRGAAAFAGNQIRDSGAEAFEKNSQLSGLDLANNQISNEGAIALSRNPKLYVLDVSYNKIGQLGINSLVKNHAYSLSMMGNPGNDNRDFAEG